MSIELRHMSKTFGNFQALRDVSLTINDGELVALLGPSGSGKTTLLRIIAGLETPDPGAETQVSFDDENVLNRSARDRHVGFVFQHYALFRHLNVFENVAFGLRVRPRRTRPSKEEIRQKVQELLKLVQLEGLEKRYPTQLSGGQRQRVALARALAVEPQVLLLDEPFGALDAKVRQELRRWLRRLHDEIHITSVFVTHDQEEALEVADRIVVMNQGRIEQVGVPDEVFHRPANEFVMRFLGNVNLFHGRVQQGRGIFGSLVIEDQQAVPQVEDGSARMLVRPHQIDLALQPDATRSLKAEVTRICSAGPIVKIDLRLAEDHSTVYAELPHERFEKLGIALHSTVYIGLKETRVFVDDYSI